MSFDEVESTIANDFLDERNGAGESKTRANSIMARIRAEIGTRDVVLLVFVRMWLVVLEFGAHVYASTRSHGAASDRTQLNPNI